MGFYIRKSISVGPFRFNLSKSGVGVSAGVTGFRVGMGPRGNYIHMGRGGLYYRATLPSGSPARNPSYSFQPHEQISPPIPPGTHAPLEEIESADISQIVDSSSRELLDEMNVKRRKERWCPIVATVSVVVLFAGVALAWQAWQIGLALFAGCAATFAAHTRDALQKTVVLFYDFDSSMEAAYAKLHSAMSELAGSTKAWHIEASGKVHDSKYHAGASHLMRRKNTFIHKADPPYVKTNIETVAVGVGRQTLHFFPDRVLVYDHDGVGAVSYQELRISVMATRFIENDSVPVDAEIVDRTWAYVNKSGGPDRRFKNNKQIPVCRYEEITLTSLSGLNEVLQLSRCGFGSNFVDAIALLGKIMPKENSGAVQAT